MFYYLSGTVAHVEPYLAVIDCGGVGYACRTTSYTLSALKKGEKGKLFTYLSVRQDGVDLFGQTVAIQGESDGGSGIPVIPENKLSEASAALAVLGYSQGEINLALKGVDLDALTLEQVIKEALKKMMKG